MSEIWLSLSCANFSKCASFDFGGVKRVGSRKIDVTTTK